MSVIEVNKTNFEEEVLEASKPVLVDFFATWCGPCKVLSPILEEISNEEENAKICKVNIDEDPDLAAKYSISAVPTLIIFKEGKPVDTLVGVNPKNVILSKLS
jgi:thioredoxin 1